MLYHPDMNERGERVDTFTLPGEAIRIQRERAISMGFIYDSDDDALNDFISVNWAIWVLKEEI